MSGNLKLCVALILVVLLSNTLQVRAEYKDSDLDGITDQSEVEKYNTNPNINDSDGDGFTDGQEIINSTNPLDFNNSPTKVLENRKVSIIEREDPVFWYISRISGIASFLIFTTVVSFGLIISSKSLLKFRFVRAVTAQEVHRTIAWSGILMVFLHFGSLFFDDYVKLRVPEVLVPFLLKRDLVSALNLNISLPVALGTIAFYLILTLVVTSELRKKVVNLKVWRTIHYSSFLAYFLFLAHGLLAGSDSNEPAIRIMYISSFTIVVALVFARIFRKKLFYPKVEVKKPEVSNEPSVAQTTTI